MLDRYLRAVRFWLPGEQQADIVAELSEDIRSQLEDRQAQLGRPLDESELADILKQRGHPMRVAERYLPQQHLIGPVLLPAYRWILRLVLPVLLAVFVVAYVFIEIGVGKGSGPHFLHWLWLLCVYAFAYVGLLTVIFALVERWRAEGAASDAWDPRHPEGLPGPRVDAEVKARRYARVDAAGDLVTDGLFALWWVNLLVLPTLPGLQLTRAAVWHSLYWPVLLLALAGMALAALRLFRPHPSRTMAILGLAASLASLAVIAVALRAGHWVDVFIPGAAPEALAALSPWIDVSAAAMLAAIAIAVTAEALRHVRTLVPNGPLQRGLMSRPAGE